MTDVTAAETIAVIPARKGSKGLPGKNVAEVGGVPLILRALDACVFAGCFDEVIVSTDDPRVEDLVFKRGYKKVLLMARPEELAGDDVTSEAVVDDALQEWTDATVALVQCTSPFLTFEQVADCVNVYRALSPTDAGTVFTAAPWHRYTWMEQHGGNVSAEECLYTTWDREKEGRAYQRLPRQKMPPRYLETGGCYVFSLAVMRRTRSRFGAVSHVVEVPAWSAIEIDSEDDLRMARWLSEQYE